jgi:hypothetical protein
MVLLRMENLRLSLANTLFGVVTIETPGSLNPTGEPFPPDRRPSVRIRWIAEESRLRLPEYFRGLRSLSASSDSISLEMGRLRTCNRMLLGVRPD